MKTLLISLVLAMGLYAQTTQPQPVCLVPTQQNCQAPALDQGVQSSAQVATSPNHASPYAMAIPAYVELTTDIYWASRTVAEQTSLRAVSCVSAASCGPRPGTANTFTPVTPDARIASAWALWQNGVNVDWEIEAIGSDPVVTMIIRKNIGITGVTGGPTPSICSSGVGCLLTTLDPSAYPPLSMAPITSPTGLLCYGVPVACLFPGVQPPTPVAPVSTKLIGNYQFDDGVNHYFGPTSAALAAVAAGVLKNGQQYSEGGVTYTVHANFGMMGQQISFSVPD